MSYIYYTNPDGTIGTMEVYHDQQGRIHPSKIVTGNLPNTGVKQRHKNLSQEERYHLSDSLWKDPLWAGMNRRITPNKGNQITTQSEVSNIISTWINTKFQPKYKNINKVLNRIVGKELQDYFLHQLKINGLTQTDWTAERETERQAYTEQRKQQNIRVVRESQLQQWKKTIDGLISTWFSKGQIPSDKRIGKLRNLMSEVAKNYFDEQVISLRERLSSESVTLKKYNKFSDVLNLINEIYDKIPSLTESEINVYKKEMQDQTLITYFQRRINKIKKKIKLISHPVAKEIKKSNPNKDSRTTSHISYSQNAPQYKHPSRNKPKYGYARDRFGRIQERDHYVEDRSINRYSDSCSYDREDDHDSMYDNFE